MKRITILLSWAAVLLWMGTIFYLSHQPASASSELSTGLSEIIMDTIEKFIPGQHFDVGAFHHYVRKNAHFFAYLLLGILVLYALRKSNIKGYKSLGIALLICIVYASSDEIHQLFIAGRSGEVKDVLIDSSGASIGIAVFMLARWIIKSIRGK